MITLKTDWNNRFGQVINLPIVGELMFSEDGLIEVEDNVAKELVELEIGLIYQDELLNAEKHEENAVIDNNLDSTQLLELEIQGMTVKQLHEQLKELEVLREEYKSLNKAELVKLVLEKLSN